MNIYNTPDKVTIIAEEYGNVATLEGSYSPLPESVTSLEYLIYKYDTNGCLYRTPVTSGSISLEDAKVDLQLPDGKYLVEISVVSTEELSYTPLQEDFYVIYNRLPSLLKTISDVLCSNNCHNCQEVSEESILKAFFNLVLFLNCTGLIEDLPAFKAINCGNNSLLEESCRLEKYYGSFSFDYSSKTLKLLALAIVEMYLREIRTLRADDQNLPTIKSMFNITGLEKCLYKMDFNLDEIVRIINQINCDCNG